MGTTTTTTIAQEPEEILESALVAVLAQAVSVPVEGALTPATSGTVKRVSTDTFVSVVCDLSSQDLDLARPAQFLTLSATVAVHYALSDDADGSGYRDECRKTRAVLVALTGDGCSALTTSALAVDGFVLNSTSTSFEAGDNPVNTKTYAATVNCRAISQTATETDDESGDEPATTTNNNEQEAANG